MVTVAMVTMITMVNVYFLTTFKTRKRIAGFFDVKKL